MDDSGFPFHAAVAARTALILGFLVVALRATGKRQMGEAKAHDLVTVLVAANAVQNAMTTGSGKLTVALVSAGTLVFLGWLFGTVVVRRPAVQKYFTGTPTVLVENGRARRRDLRQQGVDREELMAAVRGEGLSDLKDVRLAVLEADGEITVIPREGARPG